MVLVVRERPQGWNVEPMRFHGTNMVRCKVFSCGKRTPIVGAPPPPHPLFTLENLPDLEEALARFRGQYPIVLGDLNSDIGKSHNPCSQKDADTLMEFGLQNFRQRLRFRHLKTWSQVR